MVFRNAWDIFEEFGMHKASWELTDFSVKLVMLVLQGEKKPHLDENDNDF